MDLPEVRQCDDDESRYYGSVAVASTSPFGKWLVANPGNISMPAAGGHWEADDKLVEDWKVLGVE